MKLFIFPYAFVGYDIINLRGVCWFPIARERRSQPRLFLSKLLLCWLISCQIQHVFGDWPFQFLASTLLRVCAVVLGIYLFKAISYLVYYREGALPVMTLLIWRASGIETLWMLISFPFPSIVSPDFSFSAFLLFAHSPMVCIWFRIPFMLYNFDRECSPCLLLFIQML